MIPEFSRPHRLDQIGAGESQFSITAEPAEREALAKRFALAALDRIAAHGTLRRDAAGVIARGHLSAEVTQSCIATGDDVPATIEEDFAIRFLPEGGETQDEIELSEDDCDIVFYEGGAVDMGEAAAETLALALDPYPRSPNAKAALREAGVISEEDAAPKGALAGLGDLLKGKT